MDLYPDAKRLANADVGILEQDCTTRWELDNESLNAVFTSNFLEHLPTQSAVEKTLLEAHRCAEARRAFHCHGAEYPVRARWLFANTPQIALLPHTGAILICDYKGAGY